MFSRTAHPIGRKQARNAQNAAPIELSKLLGGKD
jgi:hypothetical protein